MTITVHGLTGALVAFLACGGLATLICGISDWLADRLRADVRHLRVHRRWDRPGAHVTFGAGRRARVTEVYLDKDAGGMAIVQPYDGDGQFLQPEWVPLADLTPVPRPAVAGEAADA